MKWRCVILTLVLHIRNEWHTCFHDRRRHVRIHDGRWNGRRVRFYDKRRYVRFRDKRRRTLRNVCLYCLHNRRRAIETRISLLSQKRTRLRYKLNRDAPKRSPHFYPLLRQFRSLMMQTRLVFLDWRWSHLRAYLICISNLSFLRSVGLTHNIVDHWL
jgi:hypothetical protein